MRLGVVAAAVVLCAGCRATPAAPGDDMAVDLSVGGGGDDLGGGDLAVGDMMCAVGPEICNNGCDDDRNGYTDGDDPACSSQMLVTLSMGTPALWRLVLEPTPHVVALDGNPITTNGAMATYNHAFAPAAFLGFEGGTKLLERLPIGGGAMSMLATTFGIRDVCTFNGELIVVEQRSQTLGGSRLHRFAPDGSSELLPAVAVANLATACSSDGQMLYVATHAPPGPSQINIFGKSANGPVATGNVIPMPDTLLNAGYDRIVDLVYLKKGGTFLGLFAMSFGAAADSALDGQLMAPLGLDGGVGAFIDGGVWHGVGEFLP